jgi:hypothetical protein
MGGHPTLSRLVDRLRELGCNVTDLSAEIIGPDGPYKVRYALNPTNNLYDVLPNVPDDEPLSPYVIGNIERRLGLVTGFPSV